MRNAIQDREFHAVATDDESVTADLVIASASDDDTGYNDEEWVPGEPPDDDDPEDET